LLYDAEKQKASFTVTSGHQRRARLTAFKIYNGTKELVKSEDGRVSDESGVGALGGMVYEAAGGQLTLTGTSSSASSTTTVP
jgi:hypothetical protein